MAKMKLLLDTHLWLWSIGEPHRLSRRVAKELDAPENQLWLSAISIWEALLLCRKGRITISEDFPTWLVGALKAVPLNDAPLTFEVGKAPATVKFPHADPADLFLAATAEAFGLRLVTADRNLIRAEGISGIAN
jgi:PIN domain nuclease of toxin-antitoxin system